MYAWEILGKSTNIPVSSTFISLITHSILRVSKRTGNFRDVGMLAVDFLKSIVFSFGEVSTHTHNIELNANTSKKQTFA